MHPARIPRTLFTLLLVAITPIALRAQAPHPEPVGLRPDAPAYAHHGPHWVGTRAFVIPPADEGVTLPATLWYPALNPEGRKEAVTYTVDTRPWATTTAGRSAALTGRALKEAATDGTAGPYPLVVFSPGFEHSHLEYAPLLEHLASYGFAVLGIDHAPDVFTRRPKDLVRAIDFAGELSAPKGALPGLIDTRRVTLVGHSVGGKTVMNVGRVHFARNGGDPYDLRVAAFVALAMAETTAFMNPAEATIPMLYWIGTEDRSRTVADMEEIVRAMPSPVRALAILRGAGHASFYDPATAALWPSPERGTLDGNRAQDLISHVTTAFLLDVIKGDPEARKALQPGAVTFGEVQYTTAWN